MTYPRDKGEGALNLFANLSQDHAPSFGDAGAEKRPHGPRVEVLPTIPGPGQLNTCPGQQGWRNRNTPGGGWNFPIFPTPLKSEFSEFWDTVKRGISSGDCATIGDTFSERETLNFLQRKKGVKSELKEPDKKGRNGSCCLCGNGAFAGVYSRGGVGGCPVGLEGKRGANTGTVGGVGGS